MVPLKVCIFLVYKIKSCRSSKDISLCQGIRSCVFWELCILSCDRSNAKRPHGYILKATDYRLLFTFCLVSQQNISEMMSRPPSRRKQRLDQQLWYLDRKQNTIINERHKYWKVFSNMNIRHGIWSSEQFKETRCLGSDELVYEKHL